MRYSSSVPYSDPARQREYQAKWVQEVRRAAIAARGGRCVQCGSPHGLQFDHKDPGRKVSHRIWSWKPARRDAELAKCQLLCEDCHKLKTSEERRAVVKHGTLTMYEKYACRCEPCRQAKRVQNAKRYVRG